MAKKSKDKASVGGRKWALRRRGADGVAEAEVIGVGERPVDDGDDRPLLVELHARRRGGGHRPRPAVGPRAARAVPRRAARRRAHQLSRGEPAIPTVYETDRS